MAVIADVTAGTPITPTWGNSIRDQVVATCTSSTRPTGSEGRLIYETDTDKVMVYNGTDWREVYSDGGFTTATTTLTASVTDPTLGTGSFSGVRYQKIGRRVVGNMMIRFGSSGAAAGSGFYVPGLPVSPVNYTTLFGVPHFIGHGMMKDNSTGAVMGAALQIGTSGIVTIVCMAQNPTDGTNRVGSTVTNTVPWTWAADDVVFNGTFSYEAAS